jgi:hypothetical protein
MSLQPLKYNSVSPVLRYNTGLFYGQLLAEEKGNKVMARVSAKLRRFGILQLLQFLQNLITAATGNPNAPTPNPHLVTLQGLYDDGVDKNNAYTAAQDTATAALAVRDEHVQAIIAGINVYIGSMESHTLQDAVKLQSLGLPLRSTPAPPQPCLAPVLVATVSADVTRSDAAHQLGAGRRGERAQDPSHRVDERPEALGAGARREPCRPRPVE